METSLFLAQLFGLCYIVVGLGILLNKGHYRKLIDESLDKALFLYFGGAMALIAGFCIVTFHNHWTSDWRVIMTVLGWLSLLKGVFLIIWPQTVVDFSRPILKNLPLVGVGALIFGLILGYFGFMA